MSGEMTFQVRSFTLKHKCSCNYQSSFVNSRFVAKKYIDQFKTQPNMLFESTVNEVKRQWKVDKMIAKYIEQGGVHAQIFLGSIKNNITACGIMS